MCAESIAPVNCSVLQDKDGFLQIADAVDRLTWDARKKAERDEWKATALRLLESTERLQSTADRAVGTAASAVGAIRNNGGSK